MGIYLIGISYLGQHVPRVSTLVAAPRSAVLTPAIEYPTGHCIPGENVVAVVAQPEG